MASDILQAIDDGDDAAFKNLLADQTIGFLIGDVRCWRGAAVHIYVFNVFSTAIQIASAARKMKMPQDTTPRGSAGVAADESADRAALFGAPVARAPAAEVAPVAAVPPPAAAAAAAPVAATAAPYTPAAPADAPPSYEDALEADEKKQPAAVAGDEEPVPSYQVAVSSPVSDEPGQPATSTEVPVEQVADLELGVGGTEEDDAPIFAAGSVEEPAAEETAGSGEGTCGSCEQPP